MPGAATAEIYFIVAMMALILIICVVAVWAFFKTYKKEMRDRAKRDAAKAADKQKAADETAKMEADAG